jgi:predicted transcriptional regulator
VTAQKLSRLEIYVEILKAVETKQPSRFRDIQEKTNVDKDSLVYAIDFLEKQDLLKENRMQNEIVYEPTSRGMLVTKFFVERSQVVPQGNLALGVSNSA